MNIEREKIANLYKEFKIFINSSKFQSDFNSFFNFLSKTKKILCLLEEVVLILM